MRVIFFLIFVCHNASGNIKLIKCLANEEYTIHRTKSHGPVYIINQLIINEIVTYDLSWLKNNFTKSVCSDANYSPSINFLYLLLTTKKSKIISSSSIFHQMEYSDLMRFSRKTFINYLSAVQSNIPHHDCLEREVPSLANLYEMQKYLESDGVSHMWDNKILLPLFKSLRNIDQIIEKCHRYVSAQSKGEEFN